jgi:hypothetical protein
LGVEIGLMITLIYLWYLTTSIDPTDPIQLKHKYHLNNSERSNFNPNNHKFFCNLCKTCTGQKSFHCTKCNRCV